MTVDLTFLGLGTIQWDDRIALQLLGGENQSVQLALYAVAFVGVFLAFEGMRQALKRGENAREARSRRMRMINANKSTEEVLAVLKVERKSGLWGKLPVVGDLGLALNQAGMTISPGLFLTMCLAGAVIFGTTSSVVIGPLAGLPLGLVLFCLIPLMVVAAARKKRMDQFQRQLPEALDLMARGLKVGHPLNVSIKSVADEMPDPIASEFGVVVDQIAYGDDLTDAFSEMAQRIDIEDMSYLSASIGIQHGAGGNLAEVLDILSSVIRKRLSMRRRIRAISSEGRLSALFLSILPFAIFGFTSITAPGYYADVMDDPLFKPFAIVVVVAVILNAVVLRKLVNFRI